MTANFIPSLNLNPMRLDDRVRQQLRRDVADDGSRLVGGLRVDLHLEVLALAHVADAGVAHRVQRVGDGPALRVEDRGFQRHEYARFHSAPELPPEGGSHTVET